MDSRLPGKAALTQRNAGGLEEVKRADFETRVPAIPKFQACSAASNREC